jgi:hypothetical protein
VENKFLGSVGPRIEQNVLKKDRAIKIMSTHIILLAYDSHGEVVVEIVRLLHGRLPVRVWRMDLHLVLGFVVDPGGRPKRGDDVLNRVAKEHVTAQIGRVVACGGRGGRGRRDRGHGHHPHAQTHGSELAAKNLDALLVERRVPRRAKRRCAAVGEAVAAVDVHSGDARRLARCELEPPQLLLDPGIAGLELGVGRKLEAQAPECEGKHVLLVVIDAGVGGAKRLLDLLDRRRHLRAVEEDIAR